MTISDVTMLVRTRLHSYLKKFNIKDVYCTFGDKDSKLTFITTDNLSMDERVRRCTIFYRVFSDYPDFYIEMLGSDKNFSKRGECLTVMRNCEFILPDV